MRRSGKENQLMFFIALSDKLCVDRSNVFIQLKKRNRLAHVVTHVHDAGLRKRLNLNNPHEFIPFLPEKRLQGIAERALLPKSEFCDKCIRIVPLCSRIALSETVECTQRIIPQERLCRIAGKKISHGDAFRAKKSVVIHASP